MMAEELDDGEFWLPSEILTDDDILMDLDLPSSGSLTGSTESETDEDDIVAGLTRHLARSASITDSSAPSSKGVNLSSSPQSTLCGFAANGQGSSRGSPVGPVSPPPAEGKDDEATWDLLYKAAGEVARMKLRSESTAANAKVGTGFFDCSAKRPFCPPPQAPTIINNNYPSIQYQQPQFPPLSHIRQQQQQFNNRVVTRRENLNKNVSNRPLGLPPSAWPPLQAQKQQQQPISTNGPAMFMGQPNQPKRETVGTGVFLPRRPSTETRKKSETNGMKTRSGKGGHKTQQQQKASLPPTANPKAIQLPQEWTY